MYDYENDFPQTSIELGKRFIEIGRENCILAKQDGGWPISCDHTGIGQCSPQEIK